MVEIRPFAPSDADALVLQPAQEAQLAGVDWRAVLRQAGESGPAWTAWRRDRVAAIAGLGLLWQGRALAWCYIGNAVPKGCWVGIHRAVATVLPEVMRSQGIRRVEADVRAGWPPGERWVRMLGFACEAPSRPGFAPDGADFALWARVAP